MLSKSFMLKGALFITSGMLLIACGNEKPKEEAETVATEDTVSASAEMPEISYSLPSPLQIASIFKKSGLKYKDGITSTQKDPAKYTNNLSKAINLGIYSADLSYAVLNKQNQQAMTYMKLSRTLADNLGMASIFEQGDLSKRFEKNLINEDSLAYIIAELQMVTDMYLDENDQQQITAIVFAGAWVESMYIGANVIESGKDKSLNSKLTEQMTILKSIIGSLKNQEAKDSAITGLVANLQQIQDIYDAMPSVKKEAESTEEANEITLTDDEVNSLTKKIAELRTKFING